jgi:hypothetical protein
MRFRRFALVALAVLALVVTFQLGARAQSNGGLVADVGFRVTGQDANGKPMGVFVVRVNGKWVDISSHVEAMPAGR